MWPQCGQYRVGHVSLGGDTASRQTFGTGTHDNMRRHPGDLSSSLAEPDSLMRLLPPGRNVRKAPISYRKNRPYPSQQVLSVRNTTELNDFGARDPGVGPDSRQCPPPVALHRHARSDIRNVGLLDRNSCFPKRIASFRSIDRRRSIQPRDQGDVPLVAEGGRALEQERPEDDEIVGRSRSLRAFRDASDDGCADAAPGGSPRAGGAGTNGL